MKIEVKDCNNCPFKVTEYNSDAIGYDTVERCNLNSFFNNEYKSIAIYDSCGDDGYSGDECDYCNSYWEEYHINKIHDIPEPVFDETKCKCEELKQAYLDSLPKVEFKTPEWCPLIDLKEINIKK